MTKPSYEELRITKHSGSPQTADSASSRESTRTTKETRRQQMKFLVIGALIATLAGCSSQKPQQEREAEPPYREVVVTTQRIVQLPSTESERLVSLKAADDAARVAHEKASKALADNHDALLSKYAGKRESIEISQDLKYVIVLPAREYPYGYAWTQGYATATTSTSAICPTKKKKRKVQ